MKIKEKTGVLAEAFAVLNSAKITKIDDKNKIKVWRIARAIKPYAKGFSEDREDAKAKLLPETFNDTLAKAQNYERAMHECKQPEISKDEYLALISEIKRCDELVGHAIKDLGEKEVELDIEPIKEDVFCNIISENGWTVGQAMLLDMIVE